MASGPDQSAHDAIKAIYGGISQKPKWLLDADLAKCFDRIDQAALLAKLNTNPKLRRVIKEWLEAGFRIRQYPAGKYNSDRNGHGQAVGCTTRIEPSPKAIKRHAEKLRETVKRHIAKKESELIETLNPQIAGWSNYYKYVSSHNVFHKLGTVLFAILYAWARASSSEKEQRLDRAQVLARVRRLEVSALRTAERNCADTIKRTMSAT